MVGMGIINSSSERDGQDRVRMQESEVEGSWNFLRNEYSWWWIDVLKGLSLHVLLSPMARTGRSPPSYKSRSATSNSSAVRWDGSTMLRLRTSQRRQVRFMSAFERINATENRLIEPLRCEVMQRLSVKRGTLRRTMDACVVRHLAGEVRHSIWQN